MNTSALRATGLSRKGTRPRVLRSAGAALAAVIAATIGRCLSVQALPWHWHVFVVLRPLGSGILWPRTTRLNDSPDVTGHATSTQTLLPHLLVIDSCASRDD